MQNTQVTLASYPEGFPAPANFAVVNSALPALAEGQVLVKTRYLSLDPYMRSQLAGRHISGSIQPGDVMLGEVVGEVVDSRAPEWHTGDIVRCMGGWQTFSVHHHSRLFPVTNIKKISHALSILGMPGLTAYAGLIWQAMPKPGDVIVIPAATGAVGATAGQLAKRAGCRVIGIVGSDEKVAYAIDTLGYDHCINRKREEVAATLDTLCPNGVDIYFDLVGGELLHTVSARLAVGARVILCGMIAETNSNERMAGPSPALWIKSRATVYGLVVYDFEPRREEFIDDCVDDVNAGKLIMREDITSGIENAPAAFCKLMRGENLGKVLVKMI